jgi:hypothetical protein
MWTEDNVYEETNIYIPAVCPRNRFHGLLINIVVGAEAPKIEATTLR